MKTASLALLAALALGACSSAPEPTPAPAAPSSTPYSFVDPNIPNEPVAEDTGDSVGSGSDYSATSLPESVQRSILDDVWEQQGYSGQAQICRGWAVDPYRMLDQFMSAASASFDRAVARDFFDGKC